MTDIAYLVKSAVVRRVVVVVIALVLGWLGIGRVHAQTQDANCTNSSFYGDQSTRCGSAAIAHQQAEAAVKQRLTDVGVAGVPYFYSDVASNAFWPNGRRVQYRAKDLSGNVLAQVYGHAMRDYDNDNKCPSGKVWNEASHTCWTDCTVPKHYDDTFRPPNGSLACDANSITDRSDGCEVVYLGNADGTYSADRTLQHCDANNYTCGSGYYYSVGLNVCAPIEPEQCPTGTTEVDGVCTKRDTCPDGMKLTPTGTCKPDENTCPAGKTKAPDGSCVDNSCPAGQIKGADGTCKKDANGDGQEDAEKSFSGGDSCSTPPACNGDPILCGSARIQWRIDCNTRTKVNISGGSCSAVPICTGEKCNAMEYAQLLQQWRGTCALEKLAEGQKAGGGSCGEGKPDADCSGLPDVLENGGAAVPDKDPTVDDGESSTAIWSQVDKAGWLGGGSCPGLPTFSFQGFQYDFGTIICQQGDVLGGLLYLFGLVCAAGIIGRAAAGG